MVQRYSEVGNAAGTYFERKSQSGADTPKALRSRGLWPINPYTMQNEAMTCNKVKLYNRWGGEIGETTSQNYTVVVVGTQQWPNESDVIAKLAEKWRGTDLSLGMYLSPEGRESVQMMYDSMLRLANGARSLKRGDFGGFVRNLNELPRHAKAVSARKFNQGDISGAFLSAHLGWEPLIKDIYEASNLKAPVDDVFEIKASKKGPPIPRWMSGAGDNPYPARSLDSSSNAFVKLQCRVTRPPTFTERFGMGNPFLIAWELVPLSFVADYFLPIGSTIDALGFISSVYGSKGYRKQYRDLKWTLRLKAGQLDWGGYGFSKEAMYRRQMIREFTRSQWSANFSAPLRSAEIKVPSSLMKLGTLSALTHQRLLSLAR